MKTAVGLVWFAAVASAVIRANYKGLKDDEGEMSVAAGVHAGPAFVGYDSNHGLVTELHAGPVVVEVPLPR